MQRQVLAGVAGLVLVLTAAGCSDDGGDTAPYTGLRVQLTTVAATPASADLAIAKSHDGDFTAGGTGEYSVTVSNEGDTPSSGEVTADESGRGEKI